MTTTVERALEILRTARTCAPNAVGGGHIHGPICDEITAAYTAAEARDLTNAGLAAEDLTIGALHITAKGRRAVDNADTTITYRGRPALTTEQAAQKHGRTTSAMRDLLSARRLDLQPVAMVNGGPVYDQEQLDAAIAGMVGRGKGGGRPSGVRGTQITED